MFQSKLPVTMKSYKTRIKNVNKITNIKYIRNLKYCLINVFIYVILYQPPIREFDKLRLAIFVNHIRTILPSIVLQKLIYILQFQLIF